MIFVIFLSKMLSLIVPVLTQRLIDNYQILANLSLATLIGGTILIAGIYYLITVSYSLLLTKLQLSWSKKLSNKFMEKVFIKSLIFFCEQIIRFNDL